MSDFKKTPLGESPESNRIKSIKKTLKSQYPVILGVFFAFLTFIFLVNQNFGIKEELQKEKAKSQMFQEKSETRSEIEILGSIADSHRQNSDELLISINSKYNEIAELEGKYEIEVLSKKCIKEQMSRMVDGLDYSREYCLEPQNLENFRESKK